MKKTICTILFLFLLLQMTFINATSSETALGNKAPVFIDFDITKDTVWPGDYNYFICSTGNDSPKILNGATLTIEEGATVYFANYLVNGITTRYDNGKLPAQTLQIESGHINANGVRFTVVPSRMDKGFEGIRIKANDSKPSSGVFNNCVFEYGADMIRTSESGTYDGGRTINLTVTGCTFRNPVSGSTGIVYDNGYHTKGKGTVRIEKTTFTGFGRGIQICRSDTAKEIDIYIDQCTFNDSGIHSVEIMDGRLASVTNCIFINNNPDSHTVQLYYGYNDSNHPDEVVLSGNVFNGNTNTYAIAVHAASKINKDKDYTNSFGNDFPDKFKYAKIFGNVGRPAWANINESGIWGNVGIPYVLTEQVRINYCQDSPMSYSDLTIKPGITVLFGNDAMLISQGKLTAEGTKEKPITFKPISGLEYAAWIEGSRYGQVFLKNCVIDHFWRGLYFSYSRTDNLNETLVSIEDCKISNTQAAAIHIEENKTPNGKIIIKNSEFGSASDGDNGMLISQSKNVSLSNCLIYGYKGNGIIFSLDRKYMELYPEALKVENCTIAKNGFSGVRLDINPNSDILPENGVVINNSIIAGNKVLNIAENEFSDFLKKPHPISINYSMIGEDKAVFTNGMYSHEDNVGYVQIPSGNFSTCLFGDPLFADAENLDFHLKSKVGRWNGEKWVKDSVNSPAINSGNPESDYSLEPMQNGKRINMGFYGNTPFASKLNQKGLFGFFNFWVIFLIMFLLLTLIIFLILIMRKRKNLRKQVEKMSDKKTNNTTLFKSKTKPGIIILTLMISMIFIFTGCNNPFDNGNQSSVPSATGLNTNNQSKDDGKIAVSLQKAPEIKLTLETVTTNDFTIKIPKGWRYELNPSNLVFGIMIYDPQKPERRVFYHYNFNPFMKSNDARNLFRTNYGANSLFGSCPVLAPATVSEFYKQWNSYIDFLDVQGLKAAVTKFSKLDIVEEHPLENYLSSYALDSAVVRAHAKLENSNIPCEGLFSGSVVSLGSYYQNGIDCYPMTVYNVMGIMAPADEFLELEQTLANVLKSFAFTESYANAYVKKSEDATKAILDNARSMQAAYDSYNDAFWARQPINSATSQKNSDSTLGYDRLYDSETGEIIRSEAGWFDQYDINREKYNNPNLYMLEDNDYDRYDKEINYYIYK
ncbi:MAG: right-handed parallel beta-helix repeat-containing protein [Eubacteriales bacterium]|nr:right-handed parallel beta-helix repeat-containing protein [Oscillospiraceae bacterium]MDD4493657.1 right-handed parallel beta-helix repeat-containing protein [Eubacteriales bacterium]